MKVQILPSAQEDLAEGFAFYEKQQAGLGSYFLDSLFADIDSLTIHAGIHRKVFGSHRLLGRIFPFAIYYGPGRYRIGESRPRLSPRPCLDQAKAP